MFTRLRLTPRQRRLATLVLLALLVVFLFLLWSGDASVDVVASKRGTNSMMPHRKQQREVEPERRRRTKREEFLDVDLPLKLPKKFTDYMDAFQFGTQECQYGTRAGLWYNFPLKRFGVGAYFQHYTWYMSFLQNERRMFVMLTQPSKTQPYQYANGGKCSQGFFCGFHPISKCTDVEVWRGSELHDEAASKGSYLGRYMKQQTIRPEKMNGKDNVVDIHGSWNANVPQTTNCRWGLWVPKQFQSFGTDAEWKSLIEKCNYAAFDHYPEGRKRANTDVLRWRSLLTAYLFQPLPEAMKAVREKLKRTLLKPGDRCVSVHVRRGDKFKDGPHREGYYHHLGRFIFLLEVSLKVAYSLLFIITSFHSDEYIERALRLVEEHKGSGTIVLHSDDLQGVLEEWKTSKYQGKVKVIYDPADSESTGFDVAKLYDMADFHNVISSTWLFSECPLSVGCLESVYYKFGVHIGVARGIWEAENNIYNASFAFGELAVPLRGWYNFVP